MKDKKLGERKKVEYTFVITLFYVTSLLVVYETKVTRETPEHIYMVCSVEGFVIASKNEYNEREPNKYN